MRRETRTPEQVWQQIAQDVQEAGITPQEYNAYLELFQRPKREPRRPNKRGWLPCLWAIYSGNGTPCRLLHKPGEFLCEKHRKQYWNRCLDELKRFPEGWVKVEEVIRSKVICDWVYRSSAESRKL